MVPLIRRYRSLSCFSSTHFHRPPVSFILTSTKLHLLLNIYTTTTSTTDAYWLSAAMFFASLSGRPNGRLPTTTRSVAHKRSETFWVLAARPCRTQFLFGRLWLARRCCVCTMSFYFLVCQFQKSKGNSEPPPPLLANLMARTNETRFSFYRKFSRRRRTLHLFTRKGCTPTAITRAGKKRGGGGLTKNLDDNHADAKQKINKWHEQFS